MTLRRISWTSGGWLGVVAVAAVLNFWQLDRVSLWNDEAFSFFAARNGAEQALRFIADDTQPPFYYVVLSAWLGLGHSVFAIRALSAVAMTLAVIPVVAAARRLFDDRTGLLAGLLFALAPICVGWAHRARPYPLQTMLVAFAFWGFVTICMQPPGERRVLFGRGNGPWVGLAWGTYAVAGGLAMLSQEPAGFFVLGCNAGVLLLILSDWRAGRTLLINWVVAQLVLILIWASWLPWMLRQFARHLTPAEIAANHAGFLVTGPQLLDMVTPLFSVGGLWRLSVVFVPLYAAIALFGLGMLWFRRRAAVPLLAPIVVPVLVCVGAFALVHPVFGYALGTCAWIVVPYCALIAHGLVSIRPWPVRFAVAALVLAGNAWGTRNTILLDTPPLDRVAAAMRPDYRPEDAIVLSDKASGRWGIGYYLGAPYPPALELGTWSAEGLANAPGQVAGRARAWVVVLEGETPAVDPAALRMRRGAERVIDGFRVIRLDACSSEGPC
jgi:hypothetical protein